MRGIRTIIGLSSVLGAVATARTPLAAQAPKGRVPAADYGKWESPAGGELSPDGKWVAYELRRVSGSNELRYRQVGAATEQIVRMAAAPQFTRDSRWLVYTIAPDTGGAGAAGGRGGRGGRGGG